MQRTNQPRRSPPRWGLPVLLTMLLLSSCTITITPLTSPGQEVAQTIPTQAHSLVNTEWVLTALGNLQTAAPVLPTPSALTLTFSADGQVQGNSGCGAYSGRYSIRDDQITIETLPQSTSTCTDPQAINQAEQFLAALHTSESFSLSNERLAIWYEQRRGMLTFTAASAVTPTPLAPSPTATADAALAAAATPFPFPTVDALATAIPATNTPAMLATPMLASPLPTVTVTPVLVPPPATTNTLTTTTSAPAPTPITFSAGVTTTVLTSAISEGATNGYTLQAQQGQTLTVTLVTPSSPLLLRISGQDGAILKPAEDGALTWTGQLPATQPYLIEVITAGPATTYTLQVTIPTTGNSTQ